MEKQVLIPDPEKKLNIIRRYLHILALLQNNRDPVDWNGSTLAGMLSLDEMDRPLSDKAIRDYINDHLRGELDLPIDMEKGGRRIELSGPIGEEMLGRIAGIYSLFVVSDTSRDDVLKNFIQKHPLDCLWMLGRIYFAKLEQKRIEFDYTTNSGYRLTSCLANPYHMVIRNNNLYLVARLADKKEPWLFIAGRIENLKVTDRRFDEDVPSAGDIFKDALGSFLGEKYRVTLRFEKGLRMVMEQMLGVLEPDIREIAGTDSCTASFTVSDDRYLCKQLFLYGGRVEVLEPKEMRDLMVEMLRDCMSVYGL
jgi:hypothetical protein